MTYSTSTTLSKPSIGRMLIPVLAFFLLASSFASITVAAQDQDNENNLVGEYTVTFTREDIPQNLAAGASYIGRWRVAFFPDGTYVADRQDVGNTVEGTYELSDSHLTITDTGGLLSCASPSASTVPGQDVSQGTYEWAAEGQTITFIADEDNCGGRQLLLTTRSLSAFVACETVPLDIALLLPVDGTPIAGDDIDEDEPLAILTPEGDDDDVQPQPPSAGTLATEENLPAVGQEIDQLLLQMTACWATGEPERWLPLLSSEFRQSLFDSSDDISGTLQAAMAQPIVWERAGDLDIDSETEVAGIVRSTVGAEDDFQRFTFVLEDGEWKWNG